MKLTIQVGDNELGFEQMLQLQRRMSELGPEKTHWHFNDCGCCVTLHGSDCAYVIGPDGEEDFFPERGCACPEHA